MYAQLQLVGYSQRDYPVYYSQQLGGYVEYDPQLGFFNPFKAIASVAKTVAKGVSTVAKGVATGVSAAAKGVKYVVTKVPTAAAGFISGGPIGAGVAVAGSVAMDLVKAKSPTGEDVWVPANTALSPDGYVLPAVGQTSSGYSPQGYGYTPAAYGPAPAPAPAAGLDLGTILPLAVTALVLLRR